MDERFVDAREALRDLAVTHLRPRIAPKWKTRYVGAWIARFRKPLPIINLATNGHRIHYNRTMERKKKTAANVKHAPKKKASAAKPRKKKAAAAQPVMPVSAAEPAAVLAPAAPAVPQPTDAPAAPVPVPPPISTPAPEAVTPAPTVTIGSPPYPLERSSESSYGQPTEERSDDAAPPRKIWLRVGVGIVIALITVYGIVRIVPCSLTINHGNWQLWAAVAPNMVCSVDMSADATAQPASQLSVFPDGIENLSQLRSLDLSGNRISQLPASISKLHDLQILRLSNNTLTTLPAEIGSLKELQELDVRHNQLIHLPEETVQLKKLQTLLASDNALTSLPMGIGLLPSLQKIDIERNHITKLPETITTLPTLTELKASGNTAAPIAATGKSSSAKAATLGPLDQTCDRNFFVNSH